MVCFSQHILHDVFSSLHQSHRIKQSGATGDPPDISLTVRTCEEWGMKPVSCSNVHMASTEQCFIIQFQTRKVLGMNTSRVISVVYWEWGVVFFLFLHPKLCLGGLQPASFHLYSWTIQKFTSAVPTPLPLHPQRVFKAVFLPHSSFQASSL